MILGFIGNIFISFIIFLSSHICEIIHLLKLVATPILIYTYAVFFTSKDNYHVVGPFLRNPTFNECENWLTKHLQECMAKDLYG